MHFKTCLFCKRSMEEFCYSIYDPGNQPYLNIVQLFGDVEESLRHGRYICHECLYIIRWIYFMKKVLADALMDEDVGENDKVIPAFNIFRVKMSQPIFVLADQGSDDDADDHEENHVPSSYIQHIQRAESVNESRTPSQHANHQYFNGDLGGQETLENGIFISESDENCLPSSEVSLADSNTNWWTPRQNSPAPREEVIAGQDQNPGENRLRQYFCTIKVCEHTCDTLDELRKHYQQHHLIEQSGLTVENYERQMLEFSKTHSSTSNSRRKKFRCLLSHCKKTFKTNECLSEHKIKEHDLMAKFWCVECYNLPFTSRDDLHQHTLIFHAHTNITQRTNEYPCKYCDKYFLEKNLLSAHQLKCHNLQFLKQAEAKQDNRTSIVKKQLYKTQKPSYTCNQNTTKRICSFKMRRQKDVFSDRRKQEVFLNWLKVKFPNFNPKPVANNFVLNKINSYSNNEQEKVLISLPPRKRRQYQAANEFDYSKVEGSVQDINNVSKSTSVDDNLGLAMETKENVLNITNESQPSIQVLDVPKNNASNLITSNTLMESSHLSFDESKTNLPSGGMVLDQNLPAAIVQTTENLIENPVMQELKCLDKMDDSLKPSDNPDKINATITQENNKLFKSCADVSQDATDEVAPSKTSALKNNLPLKTFNSRKRKKPQQSLKNADTTYLKKPNESIENLTETSSELEMPILQNATKETLVQPCKLQSVPPVLPSVISQIEEKDNDNSPPGRITMKISLKAIKQYANNKEDKREGKRKKKLKGKKKCKTLPQSPLPKAANPVIDQSHKKDMPPNSNEIVERKSKRLNHMHIPQVDNAPMIIVSKENSSLPNNRHANSHISKAPAEYSHTSRDISESETETRNEITLNKDEINMIIFGETLNCTNINSGIPLINEQIIDITDELVSTENSNNEQLLLSDAISLVPSKSAKRKKSKPKSRFGTKRKVKRKTDNILKLTLDADGKVIDRKQNHKPECIQLDADADAEDTVEGQIANIKLKDHLYARSAFNAFKHSKWEPSE